ncbi:unnamed protein product [Allacma fusca]|uniref:Uncharacterized protein n=1 Tax=Allacma fusca TaxID=39272 RepID=A0A8J2JZ94_9HEXA|nr:unnamed protein product [Allacma fusca]
MPPDTDPPENTFKVLPFNPKNPPRIVPLMSIVFDRPPTPPRKRQPPNPLLSLQFDGPPTEYHRRFRPYPTRRPPPELTSSCVPRITNCDRDDHTPGGSV